MKTIKNQQVNMVDEDGTVVAIDQPVVKNSLNARFFKKNYRKILGPSLTVPDGNMTVREILNRHTSGGFPLPAAAGEALFEGEDGLGIDPRSLDISEAHELMAHAREVLSKVKEKRQKALDEAQQKELRDALRKDIENELKKETPPAPDDKA